MIGIRGVPEPTPTSSTATITQGRIVALVEGRAHHHPAPRRLDLAHGLGGIEHA